MICNINAFKSSRFPNLFMAMFQSPKSGHIVCNQQREIKPTIEIKRFQSPKSGHIVCNFYQL